MDLSIIVPVYNVEKYILASIESIYRQGLDEERFEVIIIDDETKDHSIEVLADFISKHQNIRVVHQKNQGLSVVRNNGILMAQGAYVFLPDSDDLLIEHSVMPLLNLALESHADIVTADYLVMNDEQVSHFNGVEQPTLQYIEKTGTQVFLEDYSPYHSYVWRMLFRREFITENHITFYPGIRYQDVPFIQECYLKADKCLKTNQLLNIYRMGHESATRYFSIEKGKDLCIAISETWKLTHWEGHTPQTLRKLQNNVYASFLFLISLIAYSIPCAKDRYPLLDFLKEKAPDIAFHNTCKQQLSTFLFWKMPHTYIDGSYRIRQVLKRIRRYRH